MRAPLLNEALQLAQERTAENVVAALGTHHPGVAHPELVAAQAEARAASAVAAGIVAEELSAVAGTARTFEEAEARGRQRIRERIAWIDSASLDLVWGLNQHNFFR